MKKLALIAIVFVFFISCAPVLTSSVMQRGIYDVDFSELRQSPVLNKGKLFILGGVIVKTTLTKEGSLIEAIYVPVDSRGYLKSYGTSNERFLALYRGTKLLDPLIYSEKREVTIAGEFIETRKDTIGEMEYVYPLFEIKEIHLWEEYREPDYYPYPPPYYPPPPYYRLRHYPYYDYPYYPWWW
jgi:outer membrane lipoprotein